MMRLNRMKVIAITALVLGSMHFACMLNNQGKATASTSVSTGNPTGIEVLFLDSSGPVALSGRVEVYAATQIPVPGFSHGPLISKSLSDQTQMTLSAADFVALQDSLWPKSSIDSDSTRGFNVVVTGDSQGAVLKGLGFERKSGTFALRAEDSTAILKENTAVVWGVVAPLMEISGQIDTNDLFPKMAHYLFVYGTGYYSLGESGQFVFPKMPLGEYESFLISHWKKDGPLYGEDSLEVFSLDATLKSGKESFLNPVDVQEIIPVPDSLKSSKTSENP